MTLAKAKVCRVCLQVDEAGVTFDDATGTESHLCDPCSLAVLRSMLSKNTASTTAILETGAESGAGTECEHYWVPASLGKGWRCADCGSYSQDPFKAPAPDPKDFRPRRARI